MTLDEAAIWLRVIVYVATIVGVVMWARTHDERIDWLGMAVLGFGAAVSGFSGLHGDAALLDLFRMPVTAVVCVYVLLRQSAPDRRHVRLHHDDDAAQQPKEEYRA